MQEYLKRHEEKEAEKKGLKTGAESRNESGINPWNKQDTFPSENFAFYILWF